jgi:hypothetical protein
MQPFPATGAKFQISTAGGQQPRWGPEGRELYYVTLDNQLMAVPMQLGASPQWGAAVLLFSLPPAPGNFNSASWPYTPSTDGRRFLIRTSVEAAVARPITVLTNWLAAAKQTVP